MSVLHYPALAAEYISKGDGSALSMVGRRLRPPSVCVVLPEAGPPGAGIESVVPARSYLMMGDFDLSLDGRHIYWNSGRMFAASSSSGGRRFTSGFAACW